MYVRMSSRESDSERKEEKRKRERAGVWMEDMFSVVGNLQVRLGRVTRGSLRRKFPRTGNAIS